MCVNVAAGLMLVNASFAQRQVEELAEKMVGGVNQATPVAKPAVDIDVEKVVRDTQAKVDYTSDDLRDPFTLTLPQVADRTTSGGAMPKVNVEGYVWGSTLPQAIIDGAVYGVGDVVMGAKITKIDKDGITFLYNSATYIVK